MKWAKFFIYIICVISFLTGSVGPVFAEAIETSSREMIETETESSDETETEESENEEEDEEDEEEEEGEDETETEEKLLVISAVNAGAEEMIEIFRNSEEKLPLSGVTLNYENASGSVNKTIFEFPEGSEMIGERILFRLSSTGNSAKADFVYAQNMAQNGGQVSLMADGIEIDSDKAMTLSTNGGKCEYIEGKQQVDGRCALRFARERKSYQSGDKHRGENQMQVISAILAKLSSSRNYLLRIPTILDIAADSFETSFTKDEISAFIRMQLGGGTNWKTESISIDGTGSMQGTYSMGASRPLYVMIANPDSVAKATAKINEYLSNE